MSRIRSTEGEMGNARYDTMLLHTMRHVILSTIPNGTIGRDTPGL